MMNVMHAITGLNVGGAEMMLWRLLAATDRSRFASSALSILTPGVIGERIRALGLPVDSLEQRPGQLSLATLPALRRILRKRRPEVIQGWMYHGNIAATIGARAFHRTPVVWSVHHALSGIEHEKPMTRKIIWLGAKLSGSTAAIVYCSKTSARQHEAYGFDPNRTVVIPNGIDCDLFVPNREEGQHTRTTLGIPEGRFLVGMAARDHPVKGHDRLIDAAALLIGRHVDVHVLLVGGGIDAEDGAIRRRIEAEGLGERFTLLGQRDDLPVLMRCLDLYVSASTWSEAFPLVVAEAMASGVPALATDLGDCRDIVGATGDIVPPDDADALAGAIETACARPQEARLAQGDAARARVVANYALTDIVARYESLHADLAMKRAA